MAIGTWVQPTNSAHPRDTGSCAQVHSSSPRPLGLQLVIPHCRSTPAGDMLQASTCFLPANLLPTRGCKIFPDSNRYHLSGLNLGVFLRTCFCSGTRRLNFVFACPLVGVWQNTAERGWARESTGGVVESNHMPMSLPHFGKSQPWFLHSSCVVFTQHRFFSIKTVRARGLNC